MRASTQTTSQLAEVVLSSPSPPSATVLVVAASQKRNIRTLIFTQGFAVADTPRQDNLPRVARARSNRETIGVVREQLHSFPSLSNLWCSVNVAFSEVYVSLCDHQNDRID
jgi:hypothetical protein